MSDIWTIELEKEESALTAELVQQTGEGYTLPMAGPDILGGVKPVRKTDEMTKKVGIDENGRLWSEQESTQVIEEVVGKYLQKNPIVSEETDPTVPEWAKQPEKPTYTAAEVGALPADTVIPEMPYVPTFMEGAEAGQVLAVKSVDESGKPVEVEAVAIERGPKGDPGVYTLSQGESLENAPSDASVIIDPYGTPDYTIGDIIAEVLEVINNDTY